MKHRFCGVFKYRKQMYVDRHAYANGPRCAVFPPKPLYRGLTVEQFAAEIESALDEYTSLGRSIYADEWQEREVQALAFFGEKSSSTFRRKVKEVGVRHNVNEGTYLLSDGTTGKPIIEAGSILEVAYSIYAHLGEPTTEPPNSAELLT